MRERRYVKFRVDMYEDTKFKIIDMKPERDTIHYIWNRIVMLAGKVNMEGDLFLSKSIPYTVETLAIEFNRDSSQVKLALDTFIELEMVEFIEDRIYRVKNFVKHQNIKLKEKEVAKNQNTEVKNNENDENRLDKTNKDTQEEYTLKNDIVEKDDLKNDTLIMLKSKNSTRKRKGKKSCILEEESNCEEIIGEEIIEKDIGDDVWDILDENGHLEPGVTVKEWSFM
jgi:predicted phage replisome organizer